MRRLLVALVLPPAVAAAVLLPGVGDGRGHKHAAYKLSASTLALLAAPQRVPQVVGSPRCFRDSPGGRCVTVCEEAVRGAGPPCPREARSGRLIPVNGRP